MRNYLLNRYFNYLFYYSLYWNLYNFLDYLLNRYFNGLFYYLFNRYFNLLCSVFDNRNFFNYLYWDLDFLVARFVADDFFRDSDGSNEDSGNNVS